jgi:hypothetical protein
LKKVQNFTTRLLVATLLIGTHVWAPVRVVAQQPPLLDRRVGIDISVPVPFGDTDTRRIANDIAKATRLPLGFQETSRRANPEGTQQPHSLRGLTAREAFDALASVDSRYSWRNIDGVVVFRPAEAWGNRLDLLSRPVPGLTWKNVTIKQAVDALQSVVDPYAPDDDLLRPDSGFPFSMYFIGGQIGDVFNALIAAHGTLIWNLRTDAAHNQVTVTLITFDGETAQRVWTPSRGAQIFQ